MIHIEAISLCLFIMRPKQDDSYQIHRAQEEEIITSMDRSLNHFRQTLEATVQIKRADYQRAVRFCDQMAAKPRIQVSTLRMLRQECSISENLNNNLLNSLRQIFDFSAAVCNFISNFLSNRVKKVSRY